MSFLYRNKECHDGILEIKAYPYIPINSDRMIGIAAVARYLMLIQKDRLLH